MKKSSTFLLLIGSIFLSKLSVAQSEQVPPVVKNRIIKMDFFSPVTGNLTFGYEQVLTNNVTLDGDLGIIGISFIDDGFNPKGLFLKAGPRFYFTPDYSFDGMRRYNDFQGAYFKPEIIYSGFGFDYDAYNPNTYTYTTERGTNNSIALMLNFGKQWVLAKVLTLDLYVGVGYGKSWEDVKDYPVNSYTGEDFVPYKYSYIEIPETPLTMSAGFNIGILLK